MGVLVSLEVSNISKIPFVFPFQPLSIGEVADEQKGGTLSNLTTQETHHTSVERITDPIDLTAKKLRILGANTQVTELQKGVVRLRVELNGETIGCGSGYLISADGLILSVNHVPALGQKQTSNPFDLVAGTEVLRNLKSWSELLSGQGDAKLIADFPLFPKPETSKTILTLGDVIGDAISDIGSEVVRSIYSGPKGYRSASAYSRFDDAIEVLSVPIQIVAESPKEDIMLARIVSPDENEPYPYIKLTDETPNSGELVYSIGHPYGIKHNALALGEVLDPDFDVEKIKKALEAHSVIFGGIGNIFGGDGPKNKNVVSGVAKAASVFLGGVNVEPLVNFLNGAVISTNRIDHGSSGGLLCNEKGEAVGITYLGFFVPFNNSWFLRYAAGVLDFHPRELPLTSVTGSVGMKKAIPFLENLGVNVTKIREGEPSGVENIEERAKKQRARASLNELWKSQGIEENEIAERLRNLGLVEEVVTAGSSYNICNFCFDSKPVKIQSLEISPDKGDPKDCRKILIKGIITTESGDVVIDSLEIDPTTFNPTKDIDPETRRLFLEYLDKNADIAQRLVELHEQILKNRAKES